MAEGPAAFVKNIEDSESEVEDLVKQIKETAESTFHMLNNEMKLTARWGEEATNAILNNNKQKKEVNEELKKISKACEDLKIESEYLDNDCKEKEKILLELQSEATNMQSNYSSLKEEYERLTEKCVQTKKETVITEHDQKILDSKREKLKLYGELTNLKWDYSNPLSSDTVTGFVMNKETDYLNAFEYKKDEMTPSEITEKIWEQIELGSGEDWSDLVSMTNIKPKNE